MVPLMMQEGYKPKGWLVSARLLCPNRRTEMPSAQGLILGTKLWYAFFPAAVDTDERFMQQMDAMTRDIGDRGKIKTNSVEHLKNLERLFRLGR